MRQRIKRWYSGAPSASYYPGDQYVDVGAADTYVNHNGSLLNLYNQVRNIVGDVRPIALHENGSIPDPAAMLSDGAKWAWFNTWHTSWLTDNNAQSWLNYIYNHDHYITLDELPALENYGQ